MTGAVGGDLFDGGLFPASEVEREPSVLLRDRYQEPPFTVLNRSTAGWQKRDAQWKSLGIQSELGRDGALTYNMNMTYAHENPEESTSTTPQTSVFSPTLVELLLRWYSRPGDRVLDPFAGGSVRGVVSSVLQRAYLGIELSGAQVEANRAQAHLGGFDATPPIWMEGDSSDLARMLEDYEPADMVLSCPPYAHLEVYSDDPRDLSNMPYPKFLEVYRDIIAQTVAATADDRFIAWVVGEVREKGGDGSLVGLIGDTVQAFRDAGAEPYNDHVMITPVGTAAVRTPKQFDASRKAGRIHEYVLVFIKGDAKRATARLGPVQ